MTALRLIDRPLVLGDRVARVQDREGMGAPFKGDGFFRAGMELAITFFLSGHVQFLSLSTFSLGAIASWHHGMILNA